MMKLALYILAVLSLFVFATHAQKEKPRILLEPQHYYTAESFTEMSEFNREMYTTGLMDGFYASALFGATDEAVRRLKFVYGGHG
jgi:hypothetical protein